MPELEDEPYMTGWNPVSRAWYVGTDRGQTVNPPPVARGLSHDAASVLALALAWGIAPDPTDEEPEPLCLVRLRRLGQSVCRDDQTDAPWQIGNDEYLSAPPCESGLPDCGPATCTDTEGVPLCERCAREMEADPACHAATCQCPLCEPKRADEAIAEHLREVSDVV